METIKNKSSILYAICEDTLLVKLIGYLTFKESLNFKSFLSKFLSQEHVLHLKLDLSKTSYMDSTFIGTVLCLYKELCKKHKDIEIVSISRDARESFNALGLNELIKINTKKASTLEDKMTKLNIKNLDINERDKKSLIECMLNSHCELYNLNEMNKEKFETLISQLSSEIKKF